MESHSNESFGAEKTRNSFSERNPGINLSNLDTNGDSEREAFRKRLDKTGVTEGFIRITEALMNQETFPDDPMKFVIQFLSDCYLDAPHTASSPSSQPPCYCEHCLPTPNASSTSPTWQEMKAELAKGRKPGRFSRRGSTVLPSLPEDKSNEPATSGLEVQSSPDGASDIAGLGELEMEGKSDTRPVSSSEYVPPRWGDTPSSSVPAASLSPLGPDLCLSQGLDQAPTLSSTGEDLCFTQGPLSSGANLCPTQGSLSGTNLCSTQGPLSSGTNLCSTQGSLSSGTNLCSTQGPLSGTNLCSTQDKEFQSGPNVEEGLKECVNKSMVPPSPSVVGPGPLGDGLLPSPAFPSGPRHAGKSDTMLAHSIMEKKKLLKKMYQGQNNPNEGEKSYSPYNNRAPQYVGPVSHQQGPPNPSARPATDPPGMPMGPPLSMINPATNQYNVAPPPLHYVFVNTGGPAGLFNPPPSPVSSSHPSPPLLSPHMGNGNSNGAPFRQHSNPSYNGHSMVTTSVQEPDPGVPNSGQSEANRNYAGKRHYEYNNPTDRQHYGKPGNDGERGDRSNGRHGDKPGYGGDRLSYNNNGSGGELRYSGGRSYGGTHKSYGGSDRNYGAQDRSYGGIVGHSYQGYANAAGDSQQDISYASRQYHYRPQHRADSSTQGRRNASGYTRNDSERTGYSRNDSDRGGYSRNDSERTGYSRSDRDRSVHTGNNSDRDLDTYYGYRASKGQGPAALGSIFPSNNSSGFNSNGGAPKHNSRPPGQERTSAKYGDKGVRSSQMGNQDVSPDQLVANSNLEPVQPSQDGSLASTQETSGVNEKCEECQK